MGKIRVEVCLISAEGLRRSPLWKLQYFAVGWIDPKDQYCTKIDSSSNGHPIWKTRFATVVDASSSDFQELAVHVEVYSREPIFLTEKLEGRTTVVLNELLAKRDKVSCEEQEHADRGSFQLRRKKSSKARGFIDMSIRVSEEKGTAATFPGHEVFDMHDDIVASGAAAGCMEASKQGSPRKSHQETGTPWENYHARDESNRPDEGSLKSAQTQTPPPPPPVPSHVGFLPTFFPRSENFSTAFVRGGSNSRDSGSTAGLGDGALAAGAMIFGDDFLSGFVQPPGLQDANLP